MTSVEVIYSKAIDGISTIYFWTRWYTLVRSYVAASQLIEKYLASIRQLLFFNVYVLVVKVIESELMR